MVNPVLLSNNQPGDILPSPDTGQGLTHGVTLLPAEATHSNWKPRETLQSPWRQHTYNLMSSTDAAIILKDGEKCFKASVVYGGSVDVQICSVMTELCVNTHALENTQTRVRGETSHGVKQEEVGDDHFSVLSFCPWGAHLNFLSYPSLSVKWGSHPGNGYGIFCALGRATVMR